MESYEKPRVTGDDPTPTPYVCNAAVVGVAAIAIAAINALVAVNYVVFGNIAGVATVYNNTLVIPQDE